MILFAIQRFVCMMEEIVKQGAMKIVIMNNGEMVYVILHVIMQLVILIRETVKA